MWLALQTGPLWLTEDVAIQLNQVSVKVGVCDVLHAGGGRLVGLRVPD